MDTVLKNKFIQLKDNLKFQIDFDNIHFYHLIKKSFNKTTFVAGSFFVSFVLSTWILKGTPSFYLNFLISTIFTPLFLAFFKKLNMKHPAKFTLLSSRLPSLFRFIPFIKSSEDSFFFSKDKITDTLKDERNQVILYDFFLLVKQHIVNIDEKYNFDKNITFFKSSLESGNFIQASNYFMELYIVAFQYEYLINNDHTPSTHDIDLLRARKSIIEEFLQEKDIHDYSLDYHKPSNKFNKNIFFQESSYSDFKEKNKS